MADEQNNNLRDRQLRMVAHKLAVAMSYLCAIDDSIDPFIDKDPQRAWQILDLVQRAKKSLVSKDHQGMLFADTRPVIDASINDENIPLTETLLYSECLDAIRKELRLAE